MDTPADPAMELRVAGRALARAGLVHAYGHCSVRLGTGSFLISAARPLGLIRTGERGIEVPLHGPLPDGVAGEVRLHRAIYRARLDLGAVCRVQPPATMALSVLARTPRALHGFSSYYAGGIPLFDSPALVRDDATATRLANVMGAAHAVVMRGNGAAVAAGDLRTAVCLAWCLEDSARLELSVLAAGLEPVPLTPHEVAQRATWHGGLADRMWAFLTDGDAEANVLP